MEFEENDIAVTIPKYQNSFIYFLIRNNIVAYVGQTKNGLVRPFSHKDKNFDEIKIIYCDENELDLLEDKYIKKYNPAYNKNVNYSMNYSLHRCRNKIRKIFNDDTFYLTELKRIIKALNINIYLNDGTSYINVDDFEKIVMYKKGN